MTSINTGPTATALHHLLAYLHAATGLDALVLLGALVATGGLGLLALCSAVEATIRWRASRRLSRRRVFHPPQW